MATIFNSVMHGLIAGGTACYLHDRAEQEISSKNSDTWTSSTLQLNHLLLLSAETLYSANIALGLFGFLVRSVFILTPLVYLGLQPDEQLPDSEVEFLEKFNALYYTAVVVNLVVTFALGNLAFAIAAFSMMALNSYATGELGRVFSKAKEVLATCAFIGYAGQAFGATGMMATLAKVSILTMGAKLFILDNKFLMDKIQASVQAMKSPATPIKPTPVIPTPVVPAPAPPSLIERVKVYLPKQNLLKPALDRAYQGVWSASTKVAHMVKAIVLWPFKNTNPPDYYTAPPVFVPNNPPAYDAPLEGEFGAILQPETPTAPPADIVFAEDDYNSLYPPIPSAPHLPEAWEPPTPSPEVIPTAPPLEELSSENQLGDALVRPGVFEDPVPSFSKIENPFVREGVFR
ncbi:MAG: hypothetical protein JSS30_02780 [Verrucomicrobia bacterium]|nr:hypothetical protein [Verrucomicrobiota bacterium]